MEDHAETMHRLAAPDYPGRAYALPVPERQLSKEAVALLWSACIDPWPKWQNVFQHSQKVLYKKPRIFSLYLGSKNAKLGCLPSKGFHQDGPWGGSPNASEPTCIQLASLSDSKVRRNFERRFGVSCVGTSMQKKHAQESKLTEEGQCTRIYEGVENNFHEKSANALPEAAGPHPAGRPLGLASHEPRSPQGQHLPTEPRLLTN